LGSSGQEGVPLRETSAGVELDIRVIPRARRTEIGGMRDGALVVRLQAPPAEGAANAALVDLLARRLDIPRHSIRLVSGEHTRRKRVAIAGVSAAMVARALKI
jgi:uncharacterized protein (TIGR00251 family)